MAHQHASRKVTVVLLTAIAAFALVREAQAISVATWDTERANVTLVNYEPGKHIVIKNKEQPETIPLSELMAVRFSANPASTVPSVPPVVWLESGGWLAISAPALANDQLTFASDFGGPGKIDVNRVRAIALHKAALGGFASAEFNKYLKEPPRSDVLLINGGGNQVLTIEGVFIKLDDTNVTFKLQGEDKERDIRREKVLAIILVPTKKFDDDRSNFVAVMGNDGSALRGHLTGLTGEAVTLEVPGMGALKIDAAKINAIDFSSGHAVYVSTLEPIQKEEVPYFDHVFPYRKDASVGEKPLSIKGIKYDRGLGVHSKCSLTYSINKQYRRLMGFVGIDSEVGGIGDVVFRVLADGKEVFNSGHVKGGEAPRRITVAVANAETLTLVVDFGNDMDIGAHADWADLKLIK